MKRHMISLLLTLCLALSLAASAFALSQTDFASGALSGIAAKPDGGLVVTDTWNKVLWQVEGDTVTRFAGVIPVEDLNGEPQGIWHDGSVENAYFADPWDIEPWLDGYAVSDASAHILRFVGDGKIYTLAGTGKSGTADGGSHRAGFRQPTGLAASDDGALYVADTEAGAIRRIDTKGNVTTAFTGLCEPMGLDWYDRALYVAESGKNRILRIRNGVQEVLAGTVVAAEDEGVYYGGFRDGAASGAEFDHPQGVAVGPNGTVYVADTMNGAVRMIREGRVYTLARSAEGSTLPVQPRSLLVQENTLYVTDLFAGSILSLPVGEPDFSDVASDAWYRDAVNEAVRRGLTSGVSASEFAPQSSMTRAMFVTMLSRLHQSSDGSAVIRGDSSFGDVPTGTWYTGPTQWAADSRVVTGTGDGNFSPDLAVTRQQIASMLYRYASDQGFDTSAATALSAFEDAEDVADWAMTAMRWAVGASIMQGSDGRLNPNSDATRAEVVQLLIRFMDLYKL